MSGSDLSTAVPSASLAAVRGMARILDELRRGGAATIGEGAQAVQVAAAETLTNASWRRLRGREGLRLVRPCPGAGLTGSVRLITLPLSPRVSLAEIRRLTDPFAEATGDPWHETEAAEAAASVQLLKLARLLPTAVLVPSAVDGLPLAAIAGRRLAQAESLQRVARARVPLVDAEETELVAFRPIDGGDEHIAILIGRPDPATPVLARLHSACLTGDLLGSLRCDCGDQLRGAIAEIARAGAGVLLYLAQEGRDIGIVNKLRAYRLQDAGLDTVDANIRLGFEPDERDYAVAAAMLRDLGFAQVRLMTNNPDKLDQLDRHGIQVVERVPHVFPANGHNLRYLQTKAEKSGHLIDM